MPVAAIIPGGDDISLATQLQRKDNTDDRHINVPPLGVHAVQRMPPSASARPKPSTRRICRDSALVSCCRTICGGVDGLLTTCRRRRRRRLHRRRRRRRCRRCFSVYSDLAIPQQVHIVWRCCVTSLRLNGDTSMQC